MSVHLFFLPEVSGTTPFSMFKAISEIAFIKSRFAFLRIFLAAPGLDLVKRSSVFLTLLIFAIAARAMVVYVRPRRELLIECSNLSF